MIWQFLLNSALLDVFGALSATWRLGVLKYCLAAGFIISYRMWAVSIVTYGLLTAYGLMLITNGSIAGTGNDYTLRLLLIIWLTCTCPSVLNL